MPNEMKKGAHEKRMQLYKRGLSDREIGEACFGVSAGGVAAWRKKHNLPPNKPGDDKAAGKRKAWNEECTVWYSPTEFLDKYYPGWEETKGQWPPVTQKECPCEICERRREKDEQARKEAGRKLRERAERDGWAWALTS